MADDYSYDCKVDGTGFGQSSSTSCWYASYCMLFNWKKKPTSSIRESIEKAGLPYAEWWNKGIPVEDYPKARLALGLTGWPGETATNILKDYQRLSETLKNYGPLWAAFSRPSEHIVLITSCDSKLDRIGILNPWNTGDADKQYLDGAGMQNRIRTTGASVLQTFLF